MTNSPLVVERTIWDVQPLQECPNIREGPINNWIDSHEVRPALVGRVSKPEFACKAVTDTIHYQIRHTKHTTVRVRPPGPNQDPLDMRELVLIRLQCLLHTLSSALIRLGGYA